MKLRVISLLLAIVLTVLLIPAPVSAAASEAADIQAQIRDTYRTALRRSGKSSFNGFCGSLVNWQTCILGIDQRVYGCDGKNEYDLYRNMGTTTGGYKVKSYPASQYTLRSALNTITANGTRDAYNILVGFQKTNTREGSIYGHALLIHAILDGVVYFAECYSASIGGRYWAEGSPIAVSIDTFCNYYDRWTVFDGIAYFGVKTYADLCEEYPASMYAMAAEKLTVYTEPFDAGVSEAEAIGSLAAGEAAKVTGLLVTPNGAGWYRIEHNGDDAYVQAQKLAYMADCWEDVSLTGLKVPTALRRGAGFCLRGNVVAQNSRIRRVQVLVYTPDEGMENPIFSGELETDSESVSLAEGKLDRAMTFRNLDVGTYQMAILADVEAYRLENGKPTSGTQTLALWHSQLEIVTGWEKYAVVTFDAGGGEVELNQTVTAIGQAVGTLPSATGLNRVLSGWSLDPEGTQLVTAETVIDGDTTLYAQWQEGNSAASGWQNTGNGWRCYSGGVPVRGWVECDGLRFYQLDGGMFATGWQTVGDGVYYFDSNGVQLTGWQRIGGERYYLSRETGRTEGWLTTEDGVFYFDSDGKMKIELTGEDCDDMRNSGISEDTPGRYAAYRRRPVSGLAAPNGLLQIRQMKKEGRISMAGRTGLARSI